MKLFTKRNLLGALLFLIFVGEPTVGLYSGLFFGPAMIVLPGLYLTLFWFYEAIINRYQLTFGRVLLLTFAMYSVLITGLLHGELANFTKPHEFLITLMIRVQCSLFPVFAYYLLNRYQPRRPATVPSVKTATLILLGYYLLLTPSKKFGFIALVDTFNSVPVIALAFSAAAIVAFMQAIKSGKLGKSFESRSFKIWCWIFLAIGCVPSLITLMLLLVLMPIVTLVYALKPAWRHSPA